MTLSLGALHTAMKLTGIITVITLLALFLFVSVIDPFILPIFGIDVPIEVLMTVPTLLPIIISLGVSIFLVIIIIYLIGLEGKLLPF